MKNFNDFDLVLKLSNIINNNDIFSTVSLIKKSVRNIKEFNLFFYDYSNKKLKDAVNNFSPIEDMFDQTAVKILYENFFKLNNCDIIIDNKNFFNIDLYEHACKTILIPLKMNESIFGMIEINFDDKKICSINFFNTLFVIANQLLMLIQNSMLKDKLQINYNFYHALKNIAKIIESQYELNYIIPLIGEMIDKFVTNHLIYIFVKNNNKFELFWPNACRDKRVNELIKKLKTDYLISEDRKIGIFPLVTEKQILGCIVAHSTIDKLTPDDIEYLNQLTKQSSATIQRANSYAEVLKHATLDALTGLNNRRQFEIRLKQEYASATRQKHPLCAMMVDIDFFKSINDTYGHDTGDKVLKTVANVIKEQLREYDIPSRYGGEEFCIILPQTKIEEANIVAQRLRNAVEKNSIETFIDKSNQNKKISVTISLGLAQLKNNDSPEDLYKKADKALYEAKERGRNRVVIYDE